MPELIGRERELAQLSELWAGAQRGSGGIVIVTAEAGGGKTALLQAFTDPIYDTGAVLWGDCVDGDGGGPFRPWLNVLPGEALPALLDDKHSEAARFQAFQESATALAGLPGAHVIVIDDLHWADGASLRFLEFLAPLVRRSKLLLIVSSRPATSGDVQAALGVLLRRGALHLELRRLTEPELASLIAGVPGWALPRIARLTGGNPLLAREYARHFASGGDPGAAPLSLSAILQAELRRLSPDAQRLAGVASLVEPVVPEMVLPAAGADHNALDEFLVSGLIHEGSAGLTWRHDALREAVAAGLSASTRLTYQAALAETCARLGDESGVAIHGCRAGSAWEPSRAHAAAVAQARVWAGRYSLEYAEGYATLARSVRHLVALQDAERLQLGTFEGELLTRLHRDVEARATLREAAELARSLGRPQALADIALHFGLGHEHGGARDAEVISLLREALDVLPASEHAVRAKLLARLAWQGLGTGEIRLRRRFAEEAVGEARMAEDPAALAAALLALCWGLPAPEDLPARRAAVDEATRAAEDARDIDLQLGALFRQFITALELGDIPAARRAAADFDVVTERCPLPYHRWNAHLFNATLALLAGDLDRAQACADQIDPPSTGQPRQAEVMLSALQGHILAQRGGDDAVRGARILCDEIDRSIGAGWLLRPRVAVDSDLASARDLLADALERLTAAPVDEDWLAFMAILAESAVLSGARRECRTIFNALQPFAGRWIVIANGAACRGPVASFLATTAQVAGLTGEAERYAAMARDDIARNDAPGMRFWLGLERRAQQPLPAIARGGLTPREAEVLALVARGHSNQEIADVLVLSVRTVHRHVENIYNRLGLHNRAEAALRAVELGLVAPSDVRAQPG